MSTVKCLHCGKEVTPEAFGGKNFCPECGNEIIEAAPVAPASAEDSAPAESPAEGSAVIKDGMGIIENTRTKVGAVDTFSDNSVTNHTTNNTTNITHIADDTKKSVICEISGKKVLVTSSVQCPVCGKTVSVQYYDEDKLRCAECEKRAVKEYEKYYTDFTKDVRVIDKDLREVLDGKAKALKLTALQVKEMELKLRKANAGKDAHLSDIKKKDFERTIVQMYQEKITPEVAFTKVSAYAKITEDAAVQCWYHAIWAVCHPKEYVDALRNATVDEYWQNYWAFAAYAKLDDIAGAVDAVDVAKEKFPENVNDIILAQAYLGACQYFSSEDEAYVSDAYSYFESIQGTDSDCLKFHYERFEELDNVFAHDDFACLNVTTLILTRRMMKGYPETGPERPALSEEHRDPPRQQSMLAAAREARQTQTSAQAPVKPAPSKPAPQPAKPATQPAKPAPARPAPAPQPATPKPSGQKGVVLNNTAGGPANPQVSFNNATPVKSKKKGGGSLFVIILILAALGAGAYFFLTKKSEPKAPVTAVEQTVVTPEAKKEPVTAPAATPAPVATPAPKAAPAPVETPVVKNEPVVKVVQAPVETPKETPVERPKTMAEKAKARKEAEAAASKSAPKVADGPGAADLAKGMEAYKAGDFKAAYDFFKSAGNAGNAEACYQIGLMLSTGKGSIAKNTLQSKVWLKKAANLGHSAAKAAIQ